MDIDLATFNIYLRSASFQDNGDEYERSFANCLTPNFPNCEILWRTIIVPQSKRIEGYPSKILNDIDFRSGIDQQLMDLASIHYSLFINLIFAHKHLQEKTISSFENFFTHLGSSCDLVETFLEKWYLLTLSISGKNSEFLQTLSEDQFLDIAKKWYRDHYENLYEYYLSKGKPNPLKLPQRKDILKEYLTNYDRERKGFLNCARAIRNVRNAIIHDIKVGRIITVGGKVMVPRPEYILEYRKWENIVKVLKNPAIVESHFIEMWTLAEEQINLFEQSINILWDIVLQEFSESFYSAENPKLRNSFSITTDLKTGATVLELSSGEVNAVSVYEMVSGSGIYYGGTANYGPISINSKDAT